MVQPAGFNNRYNFSGGPGALPESVLEQAQRSLLEVPEIGLSVLGISHRSTWFRNVVDEAADNLRALLGLSSDWHVLFLQGGSTLQFSMIPMSFLKGTGLPADYVASGYWSQKSVVEARREGEVRVLWDGENGAFQRLPEDTELHFSNPAAYFHYVSNETVEGLQFHRIPGRDDVPRICDMSSDFLCRPQDPQRFAMIYAHAQKNLGPSGVTVVLLRDEFFRRAPEGLPVMLDYHAHVAHGSIYNTPPVFAIYVLMLVTRWLRDDIGGLERMGEINRLKAEHFYKVIDQSDGFYVGHAREADRSWMNVAFTLRNRALESRFLQEAERRGFHGLEGHRSIGGLRASLYNAVTPDAVQELGEFMNEFQERHRD